jgi:hypothetical protein
MRLGRELPTLREHATILPRDRSSYQLPPLSAFSGMSRPHPLFPLSRFVLLLGAVSCNTSKADIDTTSCTHEAQIIGRTICGANGYILALTSPRDTVVTYNLPAEVGALAAQAQYLPGSPVPLFTPASFIRLKLGYSRLAPAEQTAPVCVATVWVAPFNKLTNNGREIRVLCASQAP